MTVSNKPVYTRRHLTHLPECRIYASVNWVSIDSGNGLSPVYCQAITWTNADFLLIGPFEIDFIAIRIEKQNFLFTKNAFGKVVCEMACILSMGRLVKNIIWTYPRCVHTVYDRPR